MALRRARFGRDFVDVGVDGSLKSSDVTGAPPRSNGYQSILDTHVKPHPIARKRLSELRAPMIQGLLDDIVKQTGSTSTARRVRRSGHATLKMTMDTYGHLWRDEDEDDAIAQASERIISQGNA